MLQTQQAEPAAAATAANLQQILVRSAQLAQPTLVAVAAVAVAEQPVARLEAQAVQVLSFLDTQTHFQIFHQSVAA